MVRAHAPAVRGAPRPARRGLSSKLVSTCLWRFAALAHRHGILRVVFAGDYLAMFGGVVLFHLQHASTAATSPTRGEARCPAMLGSSLLRVPPVLSSSLGIQYHHVHHFQPLIPGYMLRGTRGGRPFDDLPSGFGGVRVLDGAAVWRSRWCSAATGRPLCPFRASDLCVIRHWRHLL